MSAPTQHTTRNSTSTATAAKETTAPSTPATQRLQGVAAPKRRTNARWRPIDITVASVIAVASGLVFWMFDLVVTAPSAFLEGLVPGLSGLISGFWYIAGPLAIIIVRKPGAAIYAETIGGLLELALGNQWGFSGSLVAGLVQGVFSELVFAIVMYRMWNAWTATLSGLVTGLGGSLYSLIVLQSGLNAGGTYVVTNIIANCISGAVISGILMWYLYIAIAKSGALSHFASGRMVFDKVSR
ncbi:ECF transporter S component [Bifidobacterium aquikefiri]|uniref:ECF transporter S component n=2 Tax=Bifidobacterium aquikefiri TaxID=1653207 RepID=UPI0023F2C9BF|nr:ECF transporter S component [Bifidobacterium aquikefiri]